MSDRKANTKVVKQEKPAEKLEPKQEPKPRPGVYIVNGTRVDPNGKPAKDSQS